MLLQDLERPDPRKDPERDLAQQISGLVGGLPVAISHVAGYVAYSECSLSELLEIFKQRRRHTGEQRVKTTIYLRLSGRLHSATMRR